MEFWLTIPSFTDGTVGPPARDVVPLSIPMIQYDAVTTTSLRTTLFCVPISDNIIHRKIFIRFKKQVPRETRIFIYRFISKNLSLAIRHMNI